ncbi:WXG100 family type VII secretion target [Streptomyces mobaraensis NBRC 13819 = DSM 40847]|uniref:WXG100 family type VII secretion target n=2 Tax=Streptomyces mobaraensis TaxID=35621 RepID=A0A5N5VWV3_STRMB|nr:MULTISPECIES: WXG100 family type VII secretion target [Streptomyces]KAB7832880.1 WXG100 family type VII secretion target [Streptomyces mobaraensis]MBC2879548.1 WXG100 family type VII secretion target [Streptomyces sp. TYQ1024]QTT76022.1 WXG100 family type VII secretion target [Streptomyces mobaraensis NBRC 13819 = DSM 40847]UBI36474.1 WXG100 family type VII secretion target [Streptomyces mobaraensis]
MADLRLEVGNLDQLVKDLGTMHDTLEAKINSLKGVVATVQGGWKGDAASAYHSLQERVNEDTRRLKELLAFTKDAMQSSRQGFDQEEQERLNSFKGVGEGGTTGMGDGGVTGVLGRFHG